jgi:hypothetical protein
MSNHKKHSDVQEGCNEKSKAIKKLLLQKKIKTNDILVLIHKWL